MLNRRRFLFAVTGVAAAVAIKTWAFIDKTILIVSPSGPYFSLRSAVKIAKSGDTIIITGDWDGQAGGSQDGPLIISEPNITLIGNRRT